MPSKMTWTPLPMGGLPGAKATLNMMATAAYDGSRTLEIRNRAMFLTRQCPQKDYRAEACAVLKYVRDEIRYVRDIQSDETLQTPSVTLQVRGGDCDDKSILLAALLASIGHRTRFIAISQFPGNYCHVWVQDMIYGQWVDLEPTEPIGCGERVPKDGIVHTIYREIG